MASAVIHDRRTFTSGRLLIRPGAQASHAFLVQSGRGRVFAEQDGERTELAEVGPGEIVGEMAVIRQSRHLYGVEASTRVVAVVIAPDRLQKVLDEADPLLKTILRCMLQRIDNLNQDKQPAQILML